MFEGTRPELENLNQNRRNLRRGLSCRQSFSQEPTKGCDELKPVLLILALIDLHKAIRRNFNPEVAKRLRLKQLKGLRDHLLVSFTELLCSRVFQNALRLEMPTDYLGFQSDQAGCKQSNLFLHRAQAQTGILAFDLLRCCGFARRRLAANDVGYARDLVYLSLNVFSGAVTLRQGI